MTGPVARKRRCTKEAAGHGEQPRSGGRPGPAPSPRYRMPRGDFWALAINAVFGLLGLLLLPSNPPVGIVTTAFFGSGAVLLGWLQWRRWQDHTLHFTHVDVAAGVRILPRRGFLLVIGAWLFCLGLILVIFGGSYPALLQWLGGFIALAGAVFLVLAALRIAPPGFLQFEPNGLIVGQRGWQVLVPWEWITDVRLSDVQSNPVVLLSVAHVDKLEVTPAAAQPRALKAMAGSTWWSWGPFILFPLHFGIPSPVLAGAIARYASDAAARQNLAARQLDVQTQAKSEQAE